MKWDQANINCNQSGMIVTPIRSVNLPTYIYQAKRTIWTSNYILNLGCKENTGMTYVHQTYTHLKVYKLHYIMNLKNIQSAKKETYKGILGILIHVF